jgi:HSP20 family protein
MYRNYRLPIKQPINSYTYSSPKNTYIPAVNLEEVSDAWILTVELPGVSREEVTISTEQGFLTISGEKHIATVDGSQTFLSERNGGAFNRRFRLGGNVEAEGIKAEMRDGLLTIHLPKKSPSVSKTIEIISNN